MKRSILDQFADLEAEFGPLTSAERRRIALGIRGGATNDDVLDVDALLAKVEAIGDLNDDDIGKLEDDLVAAGLGLLDGDAIDLEGAGRVSEAIDKVRATKVERAEAAAETAASALELAKKIKGETDDGSDDGESNDDADKGDDDKADDDDKSGEAPEGDKADGDDEASGDDADKADSDAGDADADADADTDKIAASGKPRIGNVNARRPEASKPIERGGSKELCLRASANVPGVAAGTILRTPDQVYNAFREVLRSSEGYRGPRQQFPVMSVGVYDAAELYGEDRTLRDNARDNAKRLSKFTSLEALRASGGRCAPAPIDYTQPVLGSTDRPVKASMLNMGADRGGIVLQPMPTLSDVEDSFGVWTQANDVTPGSDGGTDLTGDSDGDGPETKGCLVLTCGDPHDWEVDALTSCLEVANFRKTFWAESVDAWVRKSAVWFARQAENRLLGKMGANMTHVTETGVLGTARAVLAAIDLAAVGMRQRQRLDPTYPVAMIAPTWLLNAMITDLMREHPGASAERLAVTQAQVEGFIASRNINVTWSLDGVAGQIMPAQANGVLRQFPSHVKLYLSIEGQEIFLDSGRLDFGVVRDSILNATNKFQMFSETLEGYAFHGEEHIELTLGICSNGSSSGFDEAALDLCSVS